MITLSDLQPGDLMFTTIDGIAGKAIAVAEKINDADVTWADALAVQHVAVVVESSNSTFPEVGPIWSPRIVQAMPHGAEEIQIGEDHWTSKHIYVRPAYGQSTHTSPAGLPGQALDVAYAARRYIGTPYSFADYAAIAGLHLGIRNGPIRRYVTTSKHMICSQLADQAMCDAGFHVFNDGRLPQDVTPAALYRKLLSLPGLYLIPGGSWRGCGPNTATG